MRELRFVEPGRVEWFEVPEPELGSADAALVRPIAVGTCDLDGPIVRGEVPVPGPFALGHEFVADVVSVGDSVTTIAPGVQVSVSFQISCGRCQRCLRGFTGRCSAVAAGASYGLGPLGGVDWGGALADLVRVPYADAMCLPVPAAANAAALAGLSDNLVDGWRTVAPHLTGEDDRVLVLGRGSIGLYATDVARALGATVTYVDTNQNNCEIAEKLGATVLHEPPRERYRSHPVVAHTSGTEVGLRSALRSTSSGGVCTDTGVIFGDATLPVLEMYAKGVTFAIGRADARAAMPPALAMVTNGSLHPELMVTQTADWEQAPQAWPNHQGRLVLTRGHVNSRDILGTMPDAAR